MFEGKCGKLIVFLNLILILFFLVGGPIFLQEAKKPFSQSLRADKVIVYKSRRTLEVIFHNKVIKSYKIALGKAPQGQKQQEGDNKTPEGDYVLDWRNPRSAFYKSIHISYPNREDHFKASQKNVSPGGDIFLHGIPKYFSFLGKFHSYYDWTRGCIALSNDEMDEIFELVKDGTPIEIRP